MHNNPQIDFNVEGINEKYVQKGVVHKTTCKLEISSFLNFSFEGSLPAVIATGRCEPQA